MVTRTITEKKFEFSEQVFGEIEGFRYSAIETTIELSCGGNILGTNLFIRATRIYVGTTTCHRAEIEQEFNWGSDSSEHNFLNASILPALSNLIHVCDGEIIGGYAWDIMREFKQNVIDEWFNGISYPKIARIIVPMGIEEYLEREKREFATTD